MYTGNDLFKACYKLYHHYISHPDNKKLKLSEKEIMEYEKIIEKVYHKNWNKSFHGLGINQSISAVAGVIKSYFVGYNRLKNTII